VPPKDFIEFQSFQFQTVRLKVISAKGRGQSGKCFNSKRFD